MNKIEACIGRLVHLGRLHVGLCGVLALTTLTPPNADACTIFVLTDTNRALFCNNEDWSNPKTRIWFVPASGRRFGRAYVGFDDGWAQGALNSEGLAFDWVAGFMEKWEPGPELKSVPGNPCERTLETCATVEDAIAFYRQHQDLGFSRAKILVADRTGASAIIGAKDGRLQVEKSFHCRGFGYGREVLDKMLAKPPEPTVSNGVAILRTCLQEGQYATKYSSVFDLKSGDIFLFQFPDRPQEVKLSLAVELQKGAHYYDLPRIREQLSRAPQPLLESMRHIFLNEAQSIPDQEPDVTRRLRTIHEDALGGAMRSNDYTPELWNELSPKQKEFEADLKQLGRLVSMTLVARWNEDDRRNYRYQTEFEKATLLQHYALDEKNKVTLIQSDDVEWKPATAGPAK